MNKELRSNLAELKRELNLLDDKNCKNPMDIREHVEAVIHLNYLRGKIRGYEEVFSILSDVNVLLDDEVKG